ncbi:MAG: sugar nucleotide-binding protein [Chromatiales bacterium]|nr:sugar nucleotide-binding protein [Chromatiales bacterium]
MPTANSAPEAQYVCSLRCGTVRAVGHADLDLRDLPATARTDSCRRAPRLIVNAAAYTGGRRRRSRTPKTRDLVNAEAPRVMAETARRPGCAAGALFDGLRLRRRRARRYTEESARPGRWASTVPASWPVNRPWPRPGADYLTLRHRLAVLEPRQEFSQYHAAPRRRARPSCAW